jgi:SNF2 family DNA or RNA helicase
MKAHLRWCLTGTPIHNSLDDYGALLSFIGVPALRDKSAFDYWIAGPVSQKQVGSLQKLQYLVAATAFRRTKAMVKTTVELPKKVVKIESVQLTGADRALYEFFKAKASKNVDQLTGSKQVTSVTPEKRKENTLSIINLLRLICNHGEHLLPASAINAWRTRQKEQTTDDLSFCRDPERFSLRASVSVDEGTPGSGVFTNDKGNSNASTPHTSLGEFPISPKLTSAPLTASELCLCPSAKVDALLKNLEREQRADRGTPLRPVKR